jgi:serine kinase
MQMFLFKKEILMGNQYCPKKADIWALGVILFIFLNGFMPFKEERCNQSILNQV